MYYPLLSLPYRWRAVVLSAARTWRLATDSDAPTQPALHETLDRHGWGILAPNFDSLMRLDESFRDQRFRASAVGASHISVDERRLLANVVGQASARTVASSTQKAGVAAALNVALQSTRLIMRTALQPGQAAVQVQQRWLMRNA